MRQLSSAPRFTWAWTAVIALALAVAGSAAQAQCVTSSTCYPPSTCAMAETTTAIYGSSGARVRNFSLLYATHCVPAPVSCSGFGTDVFFDATVELELSTDNGASFHPASGAAHCLMNLNGGQCPGIGVQLVTMDLSGGTLGNVRLRQSLPQNYSFGSLNIASLSGGLFRIDGFVDAFTDMSLDNGSTWTSSTGAMHLTQGAATTTPVVSSSWGALKLLYR